jgi:O-antigen/teichoic acid export membrane protein
VDSLSPGHPKSKQIIKSISALYLERALRIASTFITTVILARHLGLESFGELSYLLSFVAVFVAAASLGLDEILIRDASAPSAPTETPGTVFTLRVAACIALFPMLTLLLITTSNAPVGGIVFIAALVLLAPLYSFEQLLYSKMRAGRLAVLGTLEIIFTLSFRIYLVITGASKEWIMFSFFMEAALRLFLISLYTWKCGLMSHFFVRFKVERGIALLVQGMPLLAASLAVIGYMKLDQIMLRTMVGAEEVAIYSVAVRVTESFYFLPMILGSVLLPLLTNAKQSARYQELFDRLYKYAFYSGLSIAIVILFAGSGFIVLAFGPLYQEAGNYLKIYALSLPLVFLGVVSGKWLIIEGLQAHALYRTLAGLLANITLNIILIPRFAGAGAATATVLSQFVATFLYDFLFESTRPMALQKCGIFFLKVNK